MRCASQGNGWDDVRGKFVVLYESKPLPDTGRSSPVSASPAKKKPFYTSLSTQVLIAIAVAILLGYLRPATAIAMKPLGDAFIRLITMIITVVIFCTVVTGIAGMEDMKKVGRVGGKALLYFEVVSTLALVIGLIVGNVVRPGSSFNIDAATVGVRLPAGEEPYGLPEPA